MRPILATVLVCVAAGSSSADLTLVADGQPAAVIVVSSAGSQDAKPSALTIEEQCARCLQSHIEQASVAKLPIMRENLLENAKIENGRIVPEGEPKSTTFILIGDGILTKRLGCSTEKLEPGGIVVKTTGNALVLLGHPRMSHPVSDGGGLRQAVVAFLETLGFRYLWPGELGKVTPSLRTIKVKPLDIRFNPPLKQRHIRWSSGPVSERLRKGLDALRLTTQDLQDARRKALAGGPDMGWTVWHGLGGDLGIHGGHAFGDAWEKWGKEHLDWFALQSDGSRDQSRAGNRSRLCKSNPGLIEAIAAEIIERVNRSPDTVSVSLSPNDGGYSSFCMCDACKKLDPPNAPKTRLLVFDKVGEPQRHEVEYVSLTDRMVSFWNGIAERVARTHPNLLFVVDAYSRYSTAPVERTLHPNLVVRYVPDDARDWDAWRAKASKIYWRPNILLRERRTGMLCVYGRSLAESFRYMADHGMIAADFDSIVDNWSVHGLNYYVAARLNWNPNLSYDEILADYCRSGFGSAAEHIRKYFLLVEQAWDRSRDATESYSLTAEEIGQLRAMLATADRAAGNDATIKERIAFLRMGLNYTDLHATLDRMARASTDGRPADKAAARKLLELHFLALRDIARHQPFAVNAASVASTSGNFAAWRPLGWNDRLAAELAGKSGDPKHCLTGRENSIEEMSAVFGLKIEK